jgi:nucleoside 2-deoxyribosyltransferase
MKERRITMQSFKKSVYLAGAISYYYNVGLPQMATAWREQAEEYFNDFDIKCFNPCKENSSCWDYPQGGVIKQNYFYLKNCDIILVNLEMIADSVGTVWELSMAWRDHKPIVAFGQTYHWSNRPHMQSLIDVHLDTLEDALDYIVDMYEI